MSVADVIRPSSENDDITELPNCALINTVNVCDDADVDPDFAAYSFGPYSYLHIIGFNLIFFLAVRKNNPAIFIGFPRNENSWLYTYYYVWLFVLVAVDVPFILPSLIYPFIFTDLSGAHAAYYYSILFATSGPFLLFFMPIALMLSNYFEGVTSGIWIDPNH